MSVFILLNGIKFFLSLISVSEDKIVPLEYVTLSEYDILSQVGLVSLNLGICPHLRTLEIEAVNMTTLDLRGCGVLSQASIRCPHLSSLDASYCR